MRLNDKVSKIKVIFFLIVICLITTAVPTYRSVLKSVENIASADILILDAGHGGFDGGAESSKGRSEKNINLAIAQKVEALAKDDGWKVIMTRKDDRSLGEDVEGAIRSKKTKDLLERKRIISEVKPTAAVSIHLNSFTEDRSVHGAQVFYPAGPEDKEAIINSKRFAEIVQESIKTGLADGTNREALSKSEVLILKNPTVPIIIVECGFLSNNNEAALLETEDYQNKLAECIYKGILTFTNKEPKKNIEILDSL